MNIDEKADILIADSGSTKTDWVLCTQNGILREIPSQGINPYILTVDQIKMVLERELLPELLDLDNLIIYYYGAGCSSATNREKVREAIRLSLPNTQSYISHDLLGAARALCKNSKGIVGILGTGSNACVFDGKEITDEVVCLGHLAGDEGSGNHLGKLLLRKYFYRQLSPEMSNRFKNHIGKGKRELVKELYDSKRPNAYLAGLTRFIHQHKEHPELKDILLESFQSYIENFLFQFKEVKSVPIHFTGSVAYYFAEELKNILKNNKLTPGMIIRKPITGLIEYHTSKK